MIIWTIVATVVVMLASLAGVAFVWTGAGNWVEKNLGFLTSFAAGVFLVVSGRLILHTIEEAGSAELALIYVLAGAILVLALFSFLPLFHHHHHSTEAGHDHHSLDVRRILFSDGLHNIGDGILLAVAFSVSAVTGILAAVGVFFHELVQEVSEFFVLKQSGLSTREALLRNFAVSSTMIIGAVGGLLLAEKVEAVMPALLGIAAGSFLVVVGYDLIPHSVRKSKEKSDYLAHIGWFVAGLALMLVVMLVISEGHTH